MQALSPVLPWADGSIWSGTSVTPILRKLLGMNWVLVLVMYGLLIFGVLMIESAARHLSVSAAVLEEYGSSGLYFAAMQGRYVGSS